jgi:cytochrome c oxidase subunit 1
LPRIRSERPAFDLKYPEVAALQEKKPADASLMQEALGAADTGERQ